MARLLRHHSTLAGLASLCVLCFSGVTGLWFWLCIDGDDTESLDNNKIKLAPQVSPQTPTSTIHWQYDTLALCVCKQMLSQDFWGVCLVLLVVKHLRCLTGGCSVLLQFLLLSWENQARPLNAYSDLEMERVLWAKPLSHLLLSLGHLSGAAVSGTSEASPGQWTWQWGCERQLVPSAQLFSWGRKQETKRLHMFFVLFFPPSYLQLQE